MFLSWSHPESVRRIESRLRKTVRGILFLILLFIFAIFFAILICLFVILYTLAIFGPWLSGKVSVKGRFRSAIDFVFGIDEIHQFRDDIQTMIGKHEDIGSIESTPHQIRTNIREIHKNASEQAERGEFVLAIVTGVLSLVVGTLTGTSVIGWLLGSYSVAMGLTIGLHVVILDILAYNEKDDISLRRPKDLVFMEKWNRVILTNRRTQACILFVGFVHRISPTGYEIGNEILNEIMDKDLGWWELLFFIAAVTGHVAREYMGYGE